MLASPDFHYAAERNTPFILHEPTNSPRVRQSSARCECPYTQKTEGPYKSDSNGEKVTPGGRISESDQTTISLLTVLLLFNCR